MDDIYTAVMDFHVNDVPLVEDGGTVDMHFMVLRFLGAIFKIFTHMLLRSGVLFF